MTPTHDQPVRAEGSDESHRLAAARRAAEPFVAWRDGATVLRVKTLNPNEPVVAGRSIDHPITFDRDVVSRDHLELLRLIRGACRDESVYLLDLKSKGGAKHRPLSVEMGIPHAAAELQPVPVQPARPLQLPEGEHDVALAGKVWLLVGAVPNDLGLTVEEESDVPAPTGRQRDVLVELCRPRFERGTAVATPTNAQIALRVNPPVGADHVSDLIGAMYRKYDLRGTSRQQRIDLVELALRAGLVEDADYI